MPEMPTKDIRDSAGLAGRSKDIAAQNAEPTDAEMERGILDAMRLGLGDVARTLSTRLQDRRRVTDKVERGSTPAGVRLRYHGEILTTQKPAGTGSRALEGCFAKVKRAEEHINAVQAELLELKPSYTVECRNEVVKQRFVFLVAGPAIPLRISIIIGEVFHQLRSVFDHIAWAFASRVGVKNPRSVNFPVTDSPAEFQKVSRGDALKGMPPDALLIAERIQPYNAKPTANSSLGLLHQLDIVDKHRLPLVATYVGAVAEQRIALKGALVGNVNIIMAPDTGLYEDVEDGQHLFWLKYESPVPQPNLEADIKLSVEFVLRDVGTYKHAPNTVRAYASGQCYSWRAARVLSDLLRSGVWPLGMQTYAASTVLSFIGGSFFGEICHCASSAR